MIWRDSRWARAGRLRPSATSWTHPGCDIPRCLRRSRVVVLGARLCAAHEAQLAEARVQAYLDGRPFPPHLEVEELLELAGLLTEQDQ